MKTGDVLDAWKVDGKRLNIRTFDNLVETLCDKGFMKIAMLGRDRLFDRKDVEALQKFIPKKQPPKYIGIAKTVLEAIKQNKGRKGRGR